MTMTSIPAQSLLMATRRKHPFSILIRSALVCGLVLGNTTAPAQAGYSPPMNGLVAWWRGDGNANDSVGGHDGNPFGAMTYVPGKFGQAFSIGDGGILIPDSSAFQLTHSLTIGLWMKPTPDSWVAFFREMLAPASIRTRSRWTAAILESRTTNNGRFKQHEVSSGPYRWVERLATGDGHLGRCNWGYAALYQREPRGRRHHHDSTLWRAASGAAARRRYWQRYATLRLSVPRRP